MCAASDFYFSLVHKDKDKQIIPMMLKVTANTPIP